MSQESQQNNFLLTLENEIQYIRSFLFPKISNAKKNEFKNLEDVYSLITNQVKNNPLNDINLVSIYGSYLKTLRKFKREQENYSKLNERDIDAFRKKYEQLGIPLLSIIHDIKINVTERMMKYDINKILDFNFQMHLYSNKELCDIAFFMFQYSNLHNQHNIDDQFLKNLIEKLCLNYNVIPYHNWTHGFQLMHMYYVSYFKSQLKDFIEPFEFFTALISALAHDMNHKGYNNLYKVKKKSEISLRYAEQGVLENMHISQFFRMILQDQELDILKKFNDQLVISNIISTDMARHQTLYNELKQKNISSQKVQKNELDKYLELSKTKESDRELISNILIHACDIGNPCYIFESYMNWCYLLCQEFQDQTIKEEKNGLQVATFLAYKGKPEYYKSQIFFTSTFVLPLWVELAIPFKELQTLCQQAEKNIKQLEEEGKKVQNK